MLTWLKNLFNANAREIAKMEKTVRLVNALEPELSPLTLDDLVARYRSLMDRAGRGEGGDNLDDFLPEAFALVREVSQRTLGLRHFDSQLIGGIVLHQGRIAEMKTGEGKTLVATLAVVLNALRGTGVHLVTVNDYLAKRDARWMGPIYHALGLSVGVIQHDAAFLFDPLHELEDESYTQLRPCSRREAYLADITYGTNNEFGFDYLRDNMVPDAAMCVQRPLHYAIVDEVDSILIDEARTPLIISGQGVQSSDLYGKFARVVTRLTKDQDYHVDQKAHSVPLTEEGVTKVEGILAIDNLYDDQNLEMTHYLNAALKAKELFRKDVEYVIKDGQIVIVDEFTGRLMFGRRYSDGLHQAIEAKEGVKVRQEDQTLATITFQNFFLLYKKDADGKLGGMTGTAATEEREFRDIYGLDVVVIPTNKPMVRKDTADQVYRTEQAKFDAVVREIEELNNKGLPVLVGTRSIEKSEMLSSMIKRKGIPHQVLNAKYHEKEAAIIAQAGHLGGVTIATNMAGRGVDIILGGNPPDAVQAKEVCNLGGLHIIGTERHESRRIDNQLRGRSGRQGDPGSSRFFVSLEDELMKMFGSERISRLMVSMGVEDDVPIEHPWITKAIENAQTKVEAHHFDIRKSVKEYDDVMNKQREVIYAERRRILEHEDLKPHIMDILDRYADYLVGLYAPTTVREDEWDREGLLAAVEELCPLPPGASIADFSGSRPEDLAAVVKEWARAAYEAKERKLGAEPLRRVERYILLHMIDTKWIDHLVSMDLLREGIGLRAYAQKDPRIEYINEAFEMFEGLKHGIQEDTLKALYKVEAVQQEAAPRSPAMARNLRTNRDDGAAPAQQTVRREKKVGRNEICPCGSGKKFKKCHGVAV